MLQLSSITLDNGIEISSRSDLNILKIPTVLIKECKYKCKDECSYKGLVF
jgi:hypothetical protein